MHISPGEKIAVIGGTGSGKSTLVRLLLGLASPASGELCFDGIDSRQMSEKRIRENVSCVLQRDTIFSGTVRENVVAGRQVSDEEVWKVLGDAQLREFAEGQKEGLGYPVTQRGGNLSGGQKQRLAIARAILKPRGRVHIRRQFFGSGFYDGIQTAREAERAALRENADHRHPARGDGDDLRQDLCV